MIYHTYLGAAYWEVFMTDNMAPEYVGARNSSWIRIQLLILFSNIKNFHEIRIVAPISLSNMKIIRDLYSACIKYTMEVDLKSKLMPYYAKFAENANDISYKLSNANFKIKNSGFIIGEMKFPDESRLKHQEYLNERFI